MRLIMTITLLWTFVLTVSASAQTHPMLRQYSDRYWRMLLRHKPTWATSIGEYAYNDRLGNFSENTRRRWKSRLTALGGEVQRLDLGQLNEEDRLTRDLLERAIDDELLRLDCHLNKFPLEPLEGPHIQFPLILVSQPFRTVDDFRAYVSRLLDFTNQVNDLIINMRGAKNLRIVPPRVIIEKVLPQIKLHIVNDIEKSEFYALATSGRMCHNSTVLLRDDFGKDQA